MIKSNYEVDILVNGHAVREYFKDGNIYIEARDGNKFSIKIKNNGYRRILAVPSVDGLSVMNGKTAGFKSGGYIVNGYSSITIDGWRTSDSKVSEFFFTNQGNSYAVIKKNGGNVGVIGVAIFREKEIVYTHTDNTIYSSGGFIPDSFVADSNINYHASNFAASSLSSAPVTRSMSKQEVGTGFGQSKQSDVVSVSFAEEDHPDAVFEIVYNSREQLEKIGIDFKRVQYVTPQAFPGQYCTPPEN